MVEIGEMWRAGRIAVLDEHIATCATLQGLARHGHGRPFEVPRTRQIV